MHEGEILSSELIEVIVVHDIHEIIRCRNSAWKPRGGQAATDTAGSTTTTACESTRTACATAPTAESPARAASTTLLAKDAVEVPSNSKCQEHHKKNTPPRTSFRVH